MAKKKQEDPPKGSPAWMATFSDLMNLLLCFFVLLFSMASVDAAKFDLVVNSLKSAFSVLQSGGSTLTSDGVLIGSGISQMPGYSNYFGDTLDDTEGRELEDGANVTAVEGGGESTETETEQMTNTEETESSNTQDSQNTNQDQTENLTENQSQEQNEDQQISTSQAQEALEKKAMEESKQMAEQIEKLTTMYGLQQDVEIDYNGQYVRLTLNGALLFESGSADIRREAYKVVDNIGVILNTYKDSLIEVEGHTDNVPIRSNKFESNDVLSMYRALSVAERLRNASSLPPGNIMSAGRGEYAPIADNTTVEGRSRNRRVEIKIHNSFNSEVVQTN